MRRRARVPIIACALGFGLLGCPKQPAPSAAPPARPPSPPATAAPAPPAPPAPAVVVALPDGDASRKSVVELIERGERSLASLAGRDLETAQREERTTGAAFLVQAREALEAGDQERAEILAEKAWVLIDNLERATR